MSTTKKKKLIDISSLTNEEFQAIVKDNQKFVAQIISRIDGANIAIGKLDKFVAFTMKLASQAMKHNIELEKRLETLEKKYKSDHAYLEDDEDDEDNLEEQMLLDLLKNNKDDGWIN